MPKAKSDLLGVSLMGFVNVSHEELKLISYKYCKPGSQLKYNKKTRALTDSEDT